MNFYHKCQRSLSCTVLALLALLISQTIPAMASDIGAASKTGILRSASELDYPPFSVIKPDGTADGFSVQLLTEVTKAVGLKVRFEVGPWHTIKQELMDGDLDVLPLASYSDERDRVFDFSAPYLRMHGTIFVRKGEDSITSEADLKDREVLVMEGDTAHEYAVTHRLTDKLILTPSFEEAMTQLSAGKHDAVIIQQLVGLQLIQKLKIKNLVDISSLMQENLKPQAKPLSGFEQKFCIAVGEGNRDLLDLLNEGLTIVISNGTYQALYNKWFGPILPGPKVSLQQILKYLAYVLVPLVIITSLFIMWLLKTQVRKKIKELSFANQRLADSEQRFQLAMEFANDGLFDWNLKTNEIYYSPVWKRLVGYEDEELPNDFSVWERLTAPDDVQRSWEMQQELINRERDRFEIEFRMKHKEGYWVDILSRANAIFDEEGEAVRIVGTHVDISHRKKYENDLKKSEKRYKSAQRMGNVGNWEYDIANENFWGSDQAKRIYGFDPGGRNFTVDQVENCIPDRDNVHQSLIDLIEKKTPYNIEFEIHPVSGPDKRTIRSVAQVLNDASGEPLKVIGVIQDITEQRKSQEEKENLEKALRQARKLEAIGRLAGGVAHDFNNMLSIILGNCEMVIDDLDPSAPSIKNLKEIYRAAERSADLTRQLLAFARKQTISPKIINLNTAIEGMLKMLKRLMGEDIELVWKPHGDLWKVKMDPTQIDQILANFCVNSRDAIKDIGKVIIETGNVSFDWDYCRTNHEFVPGDFVMLAFSDDGMGMDDKTLEQIFDPFFTTKKTGEGTGLGLATIYGIVKQNNGFIHVYSEPDQGTVFKVYFPKSEVFGRETPGTDEMVRTGNETILLVEDDQSILVVISKMLQRMGYKVLSASRPSEAIEISNAVLSGDIQLLMTDVVMPEMNGRELARALSRKHPGLECLYMSGYTANVVAHRGILEEGVNFINKPFSKETLSIKLRQVLDAPA